jgi:hypothetical protein
MALGGPGTIREVAHQHGEAWVATRPERHFCGRSVQMAPWEKSSGGALGATCWARRAPFFATNCSRAFTLSAQPSVNAWSANFGNPNAEDERMSAEDKEVKQVRF